MASKRPTEITTRRSGGIPNVVDSQARSRRDGLNRSALDPSAQEAHPFGPEQGGEPRAVVGSRREDEGAAAVMVVEQALHVRLGGPRRQPSGRGAGATADPSRRRA